MTFSADNRSASIAEEGHDWLHPDSTIDSICVPPSTNENAVVTTAADSAAATVTGTATTISDVGTVESIELKTRLQSEELGWFDQTSFAVRIDHLTHPLTKPAHFNQPSAVMIGLSHSSLEREGNNTISTRGGVAFSTDGHISLTGEYLEDTRTEDKKMADGDSHDDTSDQKGEDEPTDPIVRPTPRHVRRSVILNVPLFREIYRSTARMLGGGGSDNDDDHGKRSAVMELIISVHWKPVRLTDDEICSPLAAHKTCRVFANLTIGGRPALKSGKVVALTEFELGETYRFGVSLWDNCSCTLLPQQSSQ